MRDLRELLDGAAVAIHGAHYAAMDFRRAHTTSGASVIGKAPDAWRRVAAAGADLDQMGARLCVRVGPADRLAECFNDLNAWFLVFCRSGERARLDQAEDFGPRGAQLAEALSGFEGYVSHFRRLAAERVGATMPDLAALDVDGLVAPPADGMPAPLGQ